MPDPKVDTAAELEAAKQKLADAEAAHAKAVTDAAENRTSEQLVHDLFAAIVARLGNRPDMEAMLTTLGKRIEPAPAPEEQPLPPPSATPMTPAQFREAEGVTRE
jgi:IS5 family transposase